MNSLNIEEFLETDYSTKEQYIRYKKFNTYINIFNIMVVGVDYSNHVVIDKVLDIQDSCAVYNCTLLYPLNIKISLFIDEYTKIKPGTYIGYKLYNSKHSYIHKLDIHGYIINNGVLS